MLEISPDPNKSGENVIRASVTIFILIVLISAVDTLLASILPETYFYSSMCLSSLLVTLVFLFFVYRIYLSAPYRIVLIDNMMYLDRSFQNRATVDLEYTREISLGKGLKKMSVTDAGGKMRSFNMSSFNPEAVQSLIDALADTAEKYGFHLVDENSGTSCGKAKGPGLSREISEKEALSSSSDDAPYRVK